MDKATHDVNIPNGAPVWMDLVVDDVDKGVAFYTELFGWTVNDTPAEFEGYKYFSIGDKAVGGCMRNDPSFGSPNVWSIFLRTASAEETERLAKENGGEVLMPAMTVEDNGTFSILRDAGGAAVSAWQPNKELGFGVLDEPNTPTHFELHTRDYATTVEFYTNVFGWSPTNTGDTDEFRYSVFESYEYPRAGIMDSSAFLPEGVPAHWSVYIQVTDIDAIIAKAKELGATVTQGPDDTPYGKLAVLTDPTGAMFKLKN